MTVAPSLTEEPPRGRHAADRNRGPTEGGPMSDLVNQPDPVLQGDELPTFRFALEQSEG